jgi:hypothetical protein
VVEQVFRTADRYKALLAFLNLAPPHLQQEGKDRLGVDRKLEEDSLSGVEFLVSHLELIEYNQL